MRSLEKRNWNRLKTLNKENISISVLLIPLPVPGDIFFVSGFSSSAIILVGSSAVITGFVSTTLSIKKKELKYNHQST